MFLSNLPNIWLAFATIALTPWIALVVVALIASTHSNLSHMIEECAMELGAFGRKPWIGTREVGNMVSETALCP